MDQLGSQIAEMGIEDSVEFVGYVRNGPRLFDLMKKADVLALPSRSEGFPRVLYEAMAHGLPIVASRVGSIDSVMHHAEDCMLVQPGDPLALADALERLVRDEALRRLVAEQGYRTFDRETRTSAPDQVAAVMLQVTRGQGS